MADAADDDAPKKKKSKAKNRYDNSDPMDAANDPSGKIAAKAAADAANRADLLRRAGGGSLDDMNKDAADVISRLKVGKRPFADRAKSRYGD